LSVGRIRLKWQTSFLVFKFFLSIEKNKMPSILPLLPLLAFLLIPSLTVLAGEPVTLKTELLENPLGIDTVKPRFSWIVEDSTPGAKQTAYQVQAASAPEKLAADEADLWDSGKVASGQSHLIEYSGTPLASRQQVWWRVKSWDQHGKESTWSEPAWFEIALLESEDWVGQWVKAGLKPANNEATEHWIRLTTVPVTETNVEMGFSRTELEEVPVILELAKLEERNINFCASRLRLVLWYAVNSNLTKRSDAPGPMSRRRDFSGCTSMGKESATANWSRESPPIPNGRYIPCTILPPT
jgi:hypothetical protein